MWILSIDIGGTFIKTALVNETKVKEKRSVPTPTNDQAALLALLVDIIQSYQQMEAFQSVGIAMPGAVRAGTTVFHGGAVTSLNGINLKEVLTKQVAVDVVVENDAKAAALGEATFGHLQDVQNGAAIILGTGVGVGSWLDGALRKGPHFQAGEVSFFIQDHQINGAESFAGVRLSAVRLVKQLAALLALPEDGAAVFAALNSQNNKAATELFQQYCRQAALLSFNLQCLLDLEKIVIGGGISQQPCLLEAINREYEAILNVSPMTRQTIPKLTIEAAKFQADANLIGAAKGAKLNEISN